MKPIYKPVLSITASIVFLLIASQSVKAATKTWIGATDTNWGTGTNWDLLSAPLSTDDAIIPDVSLIPAPTVSFSAVCRNLTINSGGILNGGSDILTVYGSWTNNGTFTCGTGTVYFYNTTASQTLNGILSGATGQFFNLIMNLASGTDANDNLTLNANLDITGNLTLTDGQLYLGTYTTTLDGNLSYLTAASIDYGASSTFVFNGVGKTISGTKTLFQLYNVTVNAGMSVTDNINMVAYGTTFTVYDNGTFTVGDGKNVTFNNANQVLTIDDGGLIQGVNVTNSRFVLLTDTTPTITLTGTGNLGNLLYLVFSIPSSGYSVPSLNYKAGMVEVFLVSTVTTTYTVTPTAGTLDIDGNFRLNSTGTGFPPATPTLNFSNSLNTAINIGGDFTRLETSSTAKYTKGATDTITFDGATGTQSFNPGASSTFNNITHSGASTLQLITTNLTGTSAVSGNLTNSNGTFYTNGKNLTVTGTFSNDNATLMLNGDETVTLTNDSTHGTVEYAGTVGPYDLKNWTYNNLKINGGAAVTFRLYAAATTTVNGTLNIASGILNTKDVGTVDRNLSVTGDVTIAGTLIANGSTINVAGNWANSGTFTCGSSILTLNGTTSTTFEGGIPPNTYNNIQINKTSGTDANDNLIFQTDAVTINETLAITDGELIQQVALATKAVTLSDASSKWTNVTDADLTLSGNVSNAGTIEFNGLTGNSIQITSSASPTQRNWQGAGTFTIEDVSVQDQSCIGGTPINITATSSTDNNNNINWLFEDGDTVSGVVYDNDRTTNVGTGITVGMYIYYTGGSTATDITTTGALGVFSFTNLDLSSGDMVTLYIDNDGSYEGTTVIESNGGSATSVNLSHTYVNLISQNDNITNTELNNADSTDDDIHYLVAGGTLIVDSTYNLYITTGGIFIPGGGVTIDSANCQIVGTLTLNGVYTLAINTSGTLDIDGTLNLDNNSAAITAAGDIDIAGTLDAAGVSSTITLAGDWIKTGIFTAGASTVTFNGTGAQTISGVNTFTTLVLSNTSSGGTVGFTGNATATTLTVNGTGAYNVSFTGTMNTITNAVTFLNTGTVTLGDGAGDNLAFTGGVTAIVPSGISTAGTIATTNTTMTLGDADTGVTLTAATILNSGGGAINCNGTTNGAFSLSVTSGAGTITFGNTIGNSSALSSLTINNTAPAVANFNGATNTITGTFTKQGTGDINIGANALSCGGLTLTAGTINNDANDSGAWDINGDVSIAGTLKATSSNFYVSGNWDNNGTFTAGTSTVVFDSTSSVQTVTAGTSNFATVQITNSHVNGVSFADGFTCTNFTDIQANSKITFDDASEVIVTSALTLTGGANPNEITIVSDNAGTKAQLTLQAGGTQNISQVDVTDNDANGLELVAKGGDSSITNTTNWALAGTTITWQGDVSGSWDTAGNWDKGYVPNSNDSVIIPTAGVTNEPTLNSSVNVADLTIQNGRTLTLDGNNLTVNTTFQIDSGGVLAPNGGETISTIDTNNGLVKYVGTSNVTIATNLSSYNNLEFDESGSSDPTYTLPNSAVTVTGTLTITDGILAMDDDKNLTINGNFTIAAINGAFTKSTTGILILDGNLIVSDNKGSQNLGIVQIGSNGGSAVTMGTAITADTLTIVASDELDVGGNNLTITDTGTSGLTINGTLDASDAVSAIDVNETNTTQAVIIAATGVLQMASNATLTCAGGWDGAIGNTFTITAGAKLTFDGASAAKTIDLQGASTNLDIEFDEGTDGTIWDNASNFYCRDLLITDGTFNANDDTIYISRNLTVGAAGGFTEGTSTVVFDSTSSVQTVTAGTSNFATVQITNSHADGVSFADGFTCTNFTDIQANSKITFDDASEVIVTSALTLTGGANPNEITIVSDNPGTKAQLTLQAGGTQNISQVDVTDNDASNGLELVAKGGDSSITNTTNWALAGTTITWQGDVSGSWDTADNWDLGYVPNSNDSVVIPTAGVTNEPTLDSSVSVTDLTIQNGRTLTLAGNNLTVSGTYSNEGTLQLNGDETTVSLTNDSDSGLTKFVKLTGTITIKNLSPYYDLEFDSNSGGDGDATFILPAAIDVNNNLTLTDGTLDVSGADFQINVGGSWQNPNSETFENRSGTVVFDDNTKTNTITGNTTFHNLTCITAGKQIYFTLGTDQTINNTLTLTGAIGVGNLITLRSTINNNKWDITLAGGAQTASYVDVKDSDANTNTVTCSNSVDSTNNNANWIFPSGIIIVITTPSGGITVGQTPTIIGTAEPGDTIIITGTVGGVPFKQVASTTADANGNYRVMQSDYTAILDTGANSIRAEVGAAQSAIVNITVTASPNSNQVPTITPSAEGSFVRGNKPTLTGRGLAGQTVILTVKDANGNLLLTDVATTTVDASGNWIILSSDYTTALVKGLNYLSVTVAGVTSDIGSIILTDPFGVVFDSVSNNPIQGATVTIFTSAGVQCTPGAQIAATDLNPQTTGADGFYSFLTINGDFYITVSASGYTYPSTKTSFPAGRTIVNGSKGETFTVAGAVIEMDHPLDPNNLLLRIKKEVNKKEVVIGDVVTYTVTIKNETSSDVTNVYLEDMIPAGFKYIEDRAILDNVSLLDPTGNRPILFNIGTVSSGQTRTLKYQLVVGSGVTTGNYENSAVCQYSNGTVISNRDSEIVEVVLDPLFDLGTIIGKVFWDLDENRIQKTEDRKQTTENRRQKTEDGIAGVQIVMEDGTIVTTDADGKYHVPAIIPGRHVLRINERTLPDGSYLTTDKVVIVDITPGILSKVNFGINSEDRNQKTEKSPIIASPDAIYRGVAISKDEIASSPSALRRSPYDSSESIGPRNDMQAEGKDSLLFVAMGDAKAGYNFNKGDMEPVEDNDKFKDGFWSEGKLAYYLKGKIKGKYLITSSLDTERDKKELFRNLDPDKYYPVYGDASTINYDATNTQGMLYLLIEWDKSKVLWGNYETGLTETEFAQFNRTLYGGKIHLETVSSTKFGEPNTKLIIFDARAKQRAAHNEFVGTGGSLFYLKNSNIIEGSEKIKIEVRDKITGLVLTTKQMQEGFDYEIDYSNGRIIFWQPISYIVESTSIISSNLLDGNSVYVVVDYEYETKDKYDKGIQGARLQQSLTDYINVGGTYVKEEQTDKDYELKGLDATLHLGKNATITAEQAESKSKQAESFISTDGGLSFTELATSDNDKGKAYGIKGEAKLFNRLGLASYYKKIEEGFSSTSTTSQQGKEMLGAGIIWDLTSRTKLAVSHDIQKLLDDGNPQTELQVGAEKTKSTTAQVTHQMEKLKLTGEYRHQEVTDKSEDFESEANKDEDAIAAKADYKLTEKVAVSLEQQTTLKGVTNNQTSVGVSAQPNECLSFKAKETVGTEGTATSVGTTVNVDEKTAVNATLTVSNSFEEGKSQSVVLGSQRKLNEELALTTDRTYAKNRDTSTEGNTFGLTREKDGKKLKGTFTEQQIQSNNEVANTNIFGLSGDINDKWAMMGSFERGVVQNHDGTQATRNAGALGTGYIYKDPEGNIRFKTSSKLELRTDDGEENKEQYLAYNAVEWKSTINTTLFAKANLSQTENTSDDSTEAHYKELVAGLAYRPIDFDRLNMLAKYSYLEDDSPQDQSDFSDIEKERTHTLSTEAAYDLTDKWQFVEKLAYKFGEEKVSGFDFTKTQTWLMIHRLNYNINENWQLGAEYRRLTQKEAEDYKEGALLEASRKIGEFVQIGAGYNFTEFNDDLTHLDYTSQGPFIRLTATLYDRTPEEIERALQKYLEEKIQLWVLELVNEELAKPNSPIMQKLYYYYNLAERFSSEGKLKEAKELYEIITRTGQMMYNEAEKYIRERIGLEKKIKEDNQLALAYYKEGKLLEAKEIWGKIIKEAQPEPIFLEF